MPDPRPHDTLVYRRADGTDLVFGPAAGGYKPVNAPIKRVLIDRGKADGSLGEWVPMDAQPVVVPPPVVPPPPPPPAIVRNTRYAVARPDGRRGDGITVADRPADDVVVQNELVAGYEQNVVVKNVRSLTVRRLLSHNAHAANPGPQNYTGQGLYVARCGPVRVEESALLASGRPFDQPAFVPYEYQHGAYLNYSAGRVDAAYAVFGFSSGCGAQPRPGGRLFRCVFTENSIGLLAVLGDVEVEECLFYGGRHYRTAPNMAGNMAVSAYARVTLRNNLFIGRPGQAADRARRQYDMGMLSGGPAYAHSEDGVRHASPGAAWDLAGNRCRGWPGPLTGGKAPPTAAQLAAGVTEVPGGPVPLAELDVTPLLRPDADVRAWVERALAAARKVC